MLLLVLTLTRWYWQDLSLKGVDLSRIPPLSFHHSPVLPINSTRFASGNYSCFSLALPCCMGMSPHRSTYVLITTVLAVFTYSGIVLAAAMIMVYNVISIDCSTACCSNVCGIRREDHRVSDWLYSYVVASCALHTVDRLQRKLVPAPLKASIRHAAQASHLPHTHHYSTTTNIITLLHTAPSPRHSTHHHHAP